jgi:hypothetical protein
MAVPWPPLGAQGARGRAELRAGDRRTGRRYCDGCSPSMCAALSAGDGIVRGGRFGRKTTKNHRDHDPRTLDCRPFLRGRYLGPARMSSVETHRSPSASSAQSAANASISSSCSTNATCVACFARISRTTTLRGLTRVSITTARAGARYSQSHPGISSPSSRSVGFITATSARPDRPRSPVPARTISEPTRTLCQLVLPFDRDNLSWTQKWSQRAGGVSLEMEVFEKIGSPGRSRTCDIPIN